jgi:hypothetical protein
MQQDLSDYPDQKWNFDQNFKFGTIISAVCARVGKIDSSYVAKYLRSGVLW